MKLQVKLPKLGEEAGEEATVSFFFVDEGDRIKEGQDLVEMVTDKASFKVPAPATGKIVRLVAKEDDVVKAGDVLAVMDTQG